MVTFTAFFSSQQLERIREYKGYLRCGQRALELTIPKARYVVLTDKETAPFLEPDFDIAVVAPSDTPLMHKMMVAQYNFERECTDDLSILAAPDCAVSRSDLPDSIQHPLVLTYRRPPHTINNVAFCRDHDLSSWFLRKALKEFDAMPDDLQLGLGSADPENIHNTHYAKDWGGDQEAWRLAVGEYNKIAHNSKIRVALHKSGTIHLYPCATHNHFIRRTGDPKRLSFFAYMLHFKGHERKSRMVEFIEQHLPDWIEKRGKYPPHKWSKVAAWIIKRENKCE